MTEKTETSFSKHASGLERGVYMSFLIGENILFMTVTIGLMIFWTSIGIAAATAGFIMMIARIWDAINDPILGGIVQKTGKTKFGMYKPWAFAASFILPIVLILTFSSVGVTQTIDADGNTINVANWTTIAWATVAYISFGMAYTICDVPIFSLAMTMEPDVKKRTTLLMFGRLGAGIAGIITTFLFFGVLGATGSFFWAAVILGALSFITMVPIFLAKERNIVESGEPITLGTMVDFIKNNDQLQRLLLAATISMLFTMVIMGFVPYIATEFLVDASVMVIMTVGSTLSFIITLLIMIFVEKWGAKKTMIISMIGSITFIAFGFILTMATKNQWAFIVLYFGSTLAMLVPMTLFMAKFTPECIEYGHYKTGHRQEAIGFASQTFTVKFVMGIGGFIMGILLSLTGFVSGLEAGAQAEGVGQAIVWVYLFISLTTLGCTALGFLVIYKLRTKDVRIMAAANTGAISKAEAEAELAKPYNERSVRNLIPEVEGKSKPKEKEEEEGSSEEEKE